jgi:NAD+ diphosphatase
VSNDFSFCPRCGVRLPADIDGDDPSCGCGWLLREGPRLVVAAIVELGETIVLVRNRSWPETWYGLVAGFLDRGESPEQGILRKVKEEVGLHGEVVEIVGAYPNFPRNQVLLTYHVVAHGHVVAGPDVAGIKQVPPTELRIAPLATGLAVRDWLRRRREGEPLKGA